MSETKTMTVPPFGVEADHPRNSDLLLQCIPGMRLRSAISASKGTVRNTQDPDNAPVIPEGQSIGLGSFGQIPGMQIHVNPAKLTYVVQDPMHGDERLCERVVRAMKQRGMAVANKINGVSPQEGKLDEHRMKTLCRELIWLLDAGEARMVKGPKPDLEDVDEMPGRYLLNPGSRIPNSQPTFEDEMPDWVNNLQKVGM
jgi:hypothetical protein